MLLEKTVLKFIQTKFRGRIGDAVMPAISALGNAGAVWLLLGAAYVCVPERRRLGAALFAALALELFLCNVLLKPLVGRARPFQSDGSVALLVSSPGDFSFPSGHTGASFAAAAVMFFGRSSLWGWALALAALIAFSRLYLYVHYPSDVLAGALLGILTGWLMWRLSACLDAVLS